MTGSASPLVLFGVSNMLGDIIDCALALGFRPSRVVTNVEEVLRPRTKSLAERLAALSRPPEVVPLAAFRPAEGEHYFLGTTAPARDRLVDEISERFRIAFATLVHPRAYVSPLASLAPGVFVGAGCVVAAGAALGAHVYVNRGVTIGHDTLVGAFARLMPGCNIGGHVRIGAGATVGMGANVLQELDLGARCFVGAGSVVTRDVGAGQLVVGSPAKPRGPAP
jgi:sugar O-acyltransferase (sialic acid O-acetyltransferase NeuD family)